MAYFTRTELNVLFDALKRQIAHERRRLEAPAGEDLAATIARVSPEDGAYLRACRTALGKIAARIAPI